MEIKLVNIVAVVNENYADSVMEVAKDNGARGGTIIPATGSVTSDESAKLYGIGIHPQKEIVLILVEEKIVDKILTALYKKLGSNSEAQGVYFSLPVSHASDNLLNQYKPKKQKDE